MTGFRRRLCCRSRSAFNNPETREERRKTRELWMERLSSKEMWIHEYCLHSTPNRPRTHIPVCFPRCRQRVRAKDDGRSAWFPMGNPGFHDARKFGALWVGQRFFFTRKALR